MVYCHRFPNRLTDERLCERTRGRATKQRLFAGYMRRSTCLGNDRARLSTPLPFPELALEPQRIRWTSKDASKLLLNFSCKHLPGRSMTFLTVGPIQFLALVSICGLTSLPTSFADIREIISDDDALQAGVLSSLREYNLEQFVTADIPGHDHQVRGKPLGW